MEAPEPPKGYRLAKYRETYEQGTALPALWYGPCTKEWKGVELGAIRPCDWDDFPEWCIYAIPKPRYSCELEPGDEV